MEYIIAIAVILFAFYYLKKKKTKKPKTSALRKEYSRRAGLPSTTADEHIDAYIKRLQQKYPGRSEEWYLEKMLFDLERDRS